MIQIPEKTIPAFHSQTILSLNTQKKYEPQSPLEPIFTIKPKFALSFTRSHYCFLQESDF